MNRDEMVGKISDSTFKWDFVVIGGGATGVGIAVEAASRGYSVVLFEQNDFASGTSSRCTKLIHGGVVIYSREIFGLSFSLNLQLG